MQQDGAGGPHPGLDNALAELPEEVRAAALAAFHAADEQDPTLVILQWNDERATELAEEWQLAGPEAAKARILQALQNHGARHTAHPSVWGFSAADYPRARAGMIRDDSVPDVRAAIEIPEDVAAFLNYHPVPPVWEVISIIKAGQHPVIDRTGLLKAVALAMIKLLDQMRGVEVVV